MPASNNARNRPLPCSLTADAVVIATRADRRVDLEFTPTLCAGCSGSCLWRRIRAERLEGLPLDVDVSPGTCVTVSVDQRRILLASLLLYGLPMAAILLGGALGAAVSGTDSGTLLGAVSCLAVAAWLGKRLGPRLERMTLSRLCIVPKL